MGTVGTRYCGRKRSIFLSGGTEGTWEQNEIISKIKFNFVAKNMGTWEQDTITH